jgi:hypothetical protein
LRRIEQIVTEHHLQLMDSWNGFFHG